MLHREIFAAIELNVAHGFGQSSYRPSLFVLSFREANLLCWKDPHLGEARDGKQSSSCSLPSYSAARHHRPRHLSLLASHGFAPPFATPIPVVITTKV
ncbi:unnamed protein product [Protopolystoma xenopodis]|uniref:Uncharacterized protein n=1 Tax=Protopolystoma xenopodis TaxID=117903 RepID=A0A448WMH5_9PLAT|nr:unnamed protein product [Protopolystoma xenopodis]